MTDLESQLLQAPSVNLSQNNLPKEEIKNKSLVFHYLLIVVFGLINAFVSPYLYIIIGSLVFVGASGIMLVAPVVKILGYNFAFLHLVFMLIELPIASFLLKKILSRYKNEILKNSISLRLILIIFTLIQFSYFFVPQKLNEARIEQQNPVETGERQYDFSDLATINDRNNLKYHLQIDDNNVVWIEQTKSYPDFPNNEWNFFLFKFDPIRGVGTTTQLGNSENGNIVLSSGQIYKTKDRNLYAFNDVSKKYELLVNDVSSFYGKFQNYLLLSKIELNKRSIFKFNIETKILEELSLEDSNISSDFKFNSPYLCYFSNDITRIIRFNLETGENISFPSNIAQSGLSFYPLVTQCDSEYVVYKSVSHQNGSEYSVYQISKKKYVLNKTTGYMNISSGNAKVVNNKLYFTDYSNKEKESTYNEKFKSLVVLDLVNKEEAVIASHISDDWGIDGDYLVYGVSDDDMYEGFYTKKIFIQKLTK